MLKICGDSLCRPLELIFNDCLVNGIFPSIWKKGNIVPVQEKNDKQLKTWISRELLLFFHKLDFKNDLNT